MEYPSPSRNNDLRFTTDDRQQTQPVELSDDSILDRTSERRAALVRLHQQLSRECAELERLIEAKMGRLQTMPRGIVRLVPYALAKIEIALLTAKRKAKQAGQWEAAHNAENAICVFTRQSENS